MSSEGFAIQRYMGMLLASVLIEQPTRFRPTAIFSFGTGEELLDDAGDLLGIHMLQHITVGCYTRKACRRAAGWSVSFAFAYPLSDTTQTGLLLTSPTQSVLR